MDALEPREIQHQAAIARRGAGDVVAAALDREEQVVLAGEADRGHDVGGAACADDQRWARAQLEDDDLDAGLLMWDVRRNVDATHFPERRTVVQVEFSDVSGPEGSYWLVGNRDEVDLCMKDPGFEVDLFVFSDLRTLTHVWMGDLGVDEALRTERIELHGDRALRDSFRSWFALSPLAGVERPEAARAAA